MRTDISREFTEQSVQRPGILCGADCPFSGKIRQSSKILNFPTVEMETCNSGLGAHYKAESVLF